MAHIFISYRRDDNAIAANAIYKALVQTFGEQDIFFDVHGMPLGVDWEAYLREQVHACRVMLVVIGRDWLTIRDPDTGERRLDQAVDFVRYEIETALQRNIPVIPLFLDGVRTLPTAELPESIQALTKRQGQSIRRAPDFDGDISRLVVQLERMLQSPTPTAMRVSPIRPVLMAKAKPRSLDLLRQGLPSFDWIAIPGKGYSIGKYPVTNAQFKLFIDANGYTNQQWWTEAGWQKRESEKWTQTRYWANKLFNGAEQPVVGVSWYEAVAYSQWLSEVTGENIMLPTEDQWQYAAQGEDGRQYPWGNDWDCKKCNNSVSPCNNSQTSPVRQYEGVGDSPFKVVDMAGNVWEWCLTDNKNRTNDIYSAANSRVLRGGSWNNLVTAYFRCDNRNRYTPHLRNYSRGFRLALSS
ncbi:MAG TPA: SUMF1/EgtB/PvdO family nonheme iron enzyme [Aggregatilineales bacterium]|nr:SUMF1/EgtB/PvdO family nonheme iron enzyme [Aggregatilineales bacterium]